MSLDKNHFQLFGLPQSFAVDKLVLAERQRTLQKEVHPDRFATAGERQQRLAVQMAAQVNQAFEVLSSPVKRGDYLLELAGLDTNFDSYTHQDMDFLMEQMALRDSMDELKSMAKPESALDDLIAKVDRLDQQLQQQFAQKFECGDLDSAKGSLAKMHFSQKLAAELSRVEAELLDY